jgi:hypothetical protein
MALKTYYIEVMEGYKVIVSRTTFNAKEAKQIYDELKEKYPTPYVVYRELI